MAREPRSAGCLAYRRGPALRGNLDPVETGAAKVHDHTAHAPSDLPGHDPAFVPLDADDQAWWVTAGPALAVLARTGHIAAIQCGTRHRHRRRAIDYDHRCPSTYAKRPAPSARLGTVSPAQPPALRQHIAVLEAALRAAELHRSIVKLLDACV